MDISYDAKFDTLYIRFLPGKHQVETRLVDDDIALDFDEQDRLAGIEVLGASRRLDLRYLFPIEITKTSSDSKPNSTLPRVQPKGSWNKLRSELIRCKEAGIPVETRVKHWKNWVEEVTEDYVIVRRDGTDNKCKITRSEFESGAENFLRKKRKWAIVHTLRALSSSL